MGSRNKKEHTLFVEKYRPNTLEGFMCKDETRIKLEEYIKNQDIPMLGFFGKPGSGKTTLAKLLVKNIDCDYIIVNATDERSMDVMREKIGSFASAGSFKPLKIVVLDESTHLLQASQVVLLNMIETYSLNTRFILTGNYPERLIEPLRSRLQEFELAPPTKKVVALHLSDILTKENIEFSLEGVATLVKKYYPDFRKIINYCQKYTVNGVLTIDSSQKTTDDYKQLILEELKSPTYKSFNTIRQYIADSGDSSFEELFRFLYDSAHLYSPGNEGMIAIHVNEYLYQSNFVLDKEINCLALIARILDIK
jgi:DNA polymerase III delta prime subunit